MNILRYSKFEASFTIDGQSGNPFDPSVNDVDAVFKTAKAAPIVVPAFWDGTLWRVRFTPFIVGSYKMTIKYNGEIITPDDLSASSFVCVPSTDPGFIHIDPHDTQRFLFSTGKPYYPFGMDYAWHNGGQTDYPEGLAQFGQNRLNWARIWMNNWDGKNLEWGATAAQNPPIGTYSMDVAKRWDTIIDSATQSGVYIQMTLQHHGQYTAIVDPNWSQNPFNVANGGFLQNPDDFFTNPEAIALTKAKYRYIEARYGYSTHIMAYELFNEVQNIREASSHFQDVIAWHNTMAAYIRSIDPYHHLITTSMTDPGNVLSAANVDYYQIHTYPPDIVSTLDNLAVANSPKPVFVGEWGGSASGPGDATNDLVHNGLWAGIMTPTAGAAQYWYWDSVQNNNQFPIFKSVGDFLNTDNVAELGGGIKLTASGTGNGPKGSLTFAPPLGWAPDTGLDITIANTGVVTGLGGVSSFLQGTGHMDMQSGPLVFHVAPTDATTFIVHFGDVSKQGAHPVLSLDGGAPQELDYPASERNHSTRGASLSVSLTPGTHSISLSNTGVDWVGISKIELTDFAPPIGVMARGDKRGGAFWAYSRLGAGTPLPQDATVVLNGIAPGQYSVRLWDCVADKALATTSVTVSGGTASIPLPIAVSDIAGYLTPAK